MQTRLGLVHVEMVVTQLLVVGQGKGKVTHRLFQVLFPTAGMLDRLGLVEGKVECAEDLDLGTNGRLNAEVVAGKQINLSGQVFGNVTTPGVLRMAATAKVTGDVRARSLAMEEGATLNGQCAMRPPAKRSGNET